MEEDLAIVGILLGFLAVILIVGFIMYILQAIALTRIAKREGFDKGWFAWIPILNGFVIPMMIEDEVHESLKGKFTLVYGICFAASVLLSGFIPFVGLAASVLAFYAFYILMERYSTHAVIHLVIAVVTLGITMPISLLMVSGRQNMKKTAY